MSDRERWIVYPLLFFALLLGAKDRIVPPDPLACQRLECQSLVIKSTDGRELVKLGPTTDGAVLRFFSSSDALAKIASDDVDFKPSPLRQMLEVGADSTGGYATMFGPKVAPVLKLGHHPSLELTGLIATSQDGEPKTYADNSESSDVVWGQLLEWSDNKKADNGDESSSIGTSQGDATNEK